MLSSKCGVSGWKLTVAAGIEYTKTLVASHTHYQFVKYYGNEHTLCTGNTSCHFQSSNVNNKCVIKWVKRGVDVLNRFGWFKILSLPLSLLLTHTLYLETWWHLLLWLPCWFDASSACLWCFTLPVLLWRDVMYPITIIVHVSFSQLPVNPSGRNTLIRACPCPPRVCSRSPVVWLLPWLIR